MVKHFSIKFVTFLWCAIPLFFFDNSVFALSYTYDVQAKDEHRIHVVTLSPKHYAAELVKANGNGGEGRESVHAIAKRSHADIAINGGFFDENGKPTGTLVIQGKRYRVKNTQQALLVIEAGALSILSENPRSLLGKNVSILSGIPLLVQKGKVNPSILGKKSDFYTKPHARTAIGIKADRTIVVLVAEQHSMRELMPVTMEAVGYGARGLTILELAKWMQALGCQDAINLDGGRSSALWLNDTSSMQKQIFRYEEEGIGRHIVRPVSDAIVFKKR